MSLETTIPKYQQKNILLNKKIQSIQSDQQAVSSKCLELTLNKKNKRSLQQKKIQINVNEEINTEGQEQNENQNQQEIQLQLVHFDDNGNESQGQESQLQKQLIIIDDKDHENKTEKSQQKNQLIHIDDHDNENQSEESQLSKQLIIIDNTDNESQTEESYLKKQHNENQTEESTIVIEDKIIQFDSSDIPENDFLEYFKSSEQIITESLKSRQYYLTKYLACGGQGMIFKGFRSAKQQEGVVFKIYFDEEEEEIDDEIKIMKLFEKNINTIKLIDYFKINESLFVQVIEKCKYSLRDELTLIEQNQIEFTREKLFQIIFDLLDGLIQFRIYNILHLDIKPHNILVSQEGNYVYTDFGCSEIIMRDKKIKNKGFSFYYASIEQKEDLPNISFISDVYQLGVTFLMILKIYKKKNISDQIISEFENLIRNNMVQKLQENRADCLQLHEKFIEYYAKDEYINILYNYQTKIKLIIELIPFDQNKDIPYYQRLILYYSLLILRIQRIITNYEEQIQSNPNNNHVLTNDIVDTKNSQSQSLETNKSYLNENHQKMAFSINQVGQCYSFLGELENALKYTQESLEMRKKLFSGKHPDLASSLENIGMCYLSLGNTENALKYSLESLEMRKQLFNGNHPKIASSLDKIGQCFLKQGETYRAIEYSLQSLEIRKELYKGDHPKIALSLNNVGECYQKQGSSNQQLIASLERFASLPFQTDENVGQALDSIGKRYLGICDTQNAVNYLLASMEMRKKLFNGNHPDIASSLENIGLCYNSLNQFENAIDYLLESLEMKKQIFNGNHPEIASCLYNIGSCYFQYNDVQNSRIYLLESQEMRKQLFDFFHPDLEQTRSKIMQWVCSQSQTNDTNLKTNQPKITLPLVDSSNPQISYAQHALKYFLKTLEKKLQMSFYKRRLNKRLLTMPRPQFYDYGGDSLDGENMFNQSGKDSFIVEKNNEIADTIQKIGLCYEYLGDPLLASIYKQDSKEIRSLDHYY